MLFVTLHYRLVAYIAFSLVMHIFLALCEGMVTRFKFDNSRYFSYKVFVHCGKMLERLVCRWFFLLLVYNIFICYFLLFVEAFYLLLFYSV